MRQVLARNNLLLHGAAICAYHLAVPGSNPKHTINTFTSSNYVLKFPMCLEKDENKQKEAGVGPYFNNLFLQKLFYNIGPKVSIDSTTTDANSQELILRKKFRKMHFVTLKSQYRRWDQCCNTKNMDCFTVLMRLLSVYKIGHTTGSSQK